MHEQGTSVLGTVRSLISLRQQPCETKTWQAVRSEHVTSHSFAGETRNLIQGTRAYFDSLLTVNHSQGATEAQRWYFEIPCCR